MKKMCLVLLIFILCGCSNRHSDINIQLELKSDSCKIEKQIDTHDGFLGDGDYFAKLICSNITYDTLSSNWKKLPLSKTIREALELIQCRENGCKNVYERYNIPNINNGYYYFINRRYDAKNNYDEEDLNNKSSYNFTLAMLDKDTNIMYYYELDT